jgi:hypothetical protein
MPGKTRFFVRLSLAAIIGCAGSTGAAKGKGQSASHSPEPGWYKKTIIPQG